MCHDAVRWLSHCHRQHAQKIWWSLALWLSRYVSRQTDRQTQTYSTLYFNFHERCQLSTEQYRTDPGGGNKNLQWQEVHQIFFPTDSCCLDNYWFWFCPRNITSYRLSDCRLSLLLSVRKISSYGQFRRYLKNHLFGIWEITAKCDAWYHVLYKYSYLLTYLLNAEHSTEDIASHTSYCINKLYWHEPVMLTTVLDALSLWLLSLQLCFWDCAV